MKLKKSGKNYNRKVQKQILQPLIYIVVLAIIDVFDNEDRVSYYQKIEELLGWFFRRIYYIFYFHLFFLLLSIEIFIHASVF